MDPTDPTDPEDILGSLTPSYKKNPSFKYSGFNLEIKEELCPDLTISQWISKCEEIQKTSDLIFFEMEKICTTMEVQLESSKVDPELSLEIVEKNNECSEASCLSEEEENKIWLKYTSKPAESCEKTCEAKLIDSTDPEDTPLIFKWISECEEIQKASDLNFLKMEKICSTMEAQLDESSQVDQELLLESVDNDDEYFDVNSFSKILLKTLLKYRSKPAGNLKRKREAEDLDATDPEETLGSLPPSYKKSPLSEHSGINFEMEKELCPEDTPLIVQKVNKHSYDNCLDEEENKIWLKYTSKPAESCEKTCEAKIIDSTDPEDTPLYFQWISECEEIQKRSDLNFLKMEKICSTMEAQLDETSQVDQELLLESVKNDDEYFDVNSFSKILLKKLSKYRSKLAENLRRKREAEDL